MSHSSCHTTLGGDCKGLIDGMVKCSSRSRQEDRFSGITGESPRVDYGWYSWLDCCTKLDGELG
jgi:hypothetical protein